MFKRVFWPLVFVLTAYFVYSFFKPVPQISPVSHITPVSQTEAVTLPWPTDGQAALGAEGYGVLASHNSNKPVPIASVAKTITALAVLSQKPLAADEQGPTLTLGQSDVSLFDYYYTRNGSVAQVKTGEKITEYQALEAMMIPSGNNMADSLAIWAFGSIANYTKYANQMVESYGMSNTHVGDASGFTETTTSTAEDLVKLGLQAIKQPALASVVSKSSATIPVNGKVVNLNTLLGISGVNGIKTGNTDKAGGCYLFSASRSVDGHKIKLVGALLGQPELKNAISNTLPIIKAADKGFKQTTVINKNITLANYQTPWDINAAAKPAKDLSLFVWKGWEIKIINEPNAISAPVKAGQAVGKVTIQSGGQSASTTLVIANDIPRPSFWWRLLR